MSNLTDTASTETAASPAAETTMYSLITIANWEGGVALFPTHRALFEEIAKDVAEVAEYASTPAPADPADWVQFVHEFGRKIQHYEIATHRVTVADTDVQFDLKASI